MPLEGYETVSIVPSEQSVDFCHWDDALKEHNVVSERACLSE